MDRLEPFRLEDFFYEYEHRSDLINLASSDALPWNESELGRKLADSSLVSFSYPDVKATVIPALESIFHLPAGWSILPTSGAAEAIAIAMHEMASRGILKSIGLPYPNYGAFMGLARILGIGVQKYFYKPELGWAPDEAQLVSVAEACDAIVLVNPHNPTGHRTDLAWLRTLFARLAQQNKLLILDEVFRVEDELSAVIEVAESKCEGVVLGSLSKTYGLPGLRFGWLMAHSDRISRMRTVQQYLTLSISAVSAHLATTILGNLRSFSRSQLISCNRQVLLDWVAGNKNQVSISAPQGGTTVIVEFNLKRREEELFEEFVKSGVLLVPASKFGTSDTVWFRLGYGGDTGKLKDGLQRLATSINDMAQ